MSDFLKDLRGIYGGKENKENSRSEKPGDIIKVSPSVFGIRGSKSDIKVQVLEVFSNGNLKVKTLDSQIEKVVYPSQIRNS